MAGDLEADLALALRLADEADALSMAGFVAGGKVSYETKDDGSPVTENDLAVEERIAEIVSRERPTDGIIGEEVGDSGPSDR